MKELTDEEKLIFKLANAKVLGIYCDNDIYPIDSNYCSDGQYISWEECSTKDIDEAYEWIIDYYEDRTELELIKTLDEFLLLETENKKWSYVHDLEFEDLFPSDFNIYDYVVEQKLVGIAFNEYDAKNIVKNIDPKYKPYYSSIGRYDIKGYHALNEIANYFRNKAKEIF